MMQIDLHNILSLLGSELPSGIYQDGIDLAPVLGEKRKKLLAISSIFDAIEGPKRAALVQFAHE